MVLSGVTAWRWTSLFCFRHCDCRTARLIKGSAGRFDDQLFHTLSWYEGVVTKRRVVIVQAIEQLRLKPMKTRDDEQTQREKMPHVCCLKSRWKFSEHE